MKLYIGSDIFPKTNKVVDNPKFIPRVGERIDMGWSPAATVTDVVHTYGKEEAVYILVE